MGIPIDGQVGPSFHRSGTSHTCRARCWIILGFHFFSFLDLVLKR